jgi:bifunctional non-homologous end joining protein LigD
LAQIKYDGCRRLVSCKEGSVKGLNKKGEVVQLPDSIILSLINLTKEGFVIDGEIIGEKLHVFDVLSFNEKDAKKTSCEGRLSLLKAMSFEFGQFIEIVKSSYTKSEKQKMYDDLKDQNAEGIVFKLKISEYKAGRPASGGSALKHKFVKTASFIVANITKNKRSIGLEMLNENNEKVFLGKCTVPVNKDIPKIGSVVEIKYLYCFKNGCIFQPVFKEIRTDVDIEECLMSQLVYKANQEEEGED